MLNEPSFLRNIGMNKKYLENICQEKDLDELQNEILVILPFTLSNKENISGKVCYS